MRFVRPLSASLLSLALACAGEANSVLQRSDAQATADAETPGDTGEAPSDTPGAAEDTPGPEELPDGLADDTGSEPPGDTGSGAKDTSTPPPDVPVGPPPAWGVPEVLSVGAADRIVLRGRIVTPATVLDGEVLVVGETIACVAESCAGAQGADGATVIQANGLIFPGLIDAHNHTLFDIFDLADWPLDSY